MGSDQNGIRQSPFSEAACPTPGSGAGFSGLGGSDTNQGGDQGIICSPMTPLFAGSTTKTMGGEDLGDQGQFTTLTDTIAPGTSLLGDITTSRNTVDK